jgi:hypothetical protein
MTNPTSPRDPDAILMAWLEEGPERLPETTRRAIGVATRSSRQTRRVTGVPWRPNAFRPFARLATAAAVVIMVGGGALLLLSPGSPGPGGPPSPSSSPAETPASALSSAAPSPTPSPSLAWETFTSDRFGYRVELPVDWLHSAPVDDLPDDLYPGDESAYADRWDQPVQRFPYVVIAVIDPEPETDAAWLERNVASAVAMCDASDPVAVGVDGATAERRTAACGAGVATEFVLLTHAGRTYSIEINAATSDAATASAILDHVLESFTFTD